VFFTIVLSFTFIINSFFKNKKNKRVILITTKAIKTYTEFAFKISDTLLFGRESAGVPNEVHKIADEKLKIPMSKNKRSLNLATSVGIVLAEQIRQIKN
jgi:tRNA (cytidine/uridine-2'-O-)-methyltransferase